ncbi:RICIN domain-containing protein [Actinokineospora soli]|uniref:RICIN domain-containing protein n=1 Tax=Actinokineospora soli TaxID=1048753 RepID=A0ABW2U0V6_9PSEU
MDPAHRRQPAVHPHRRRHVLHPPQRPQRTLRRRRRRLPAAGAAIIQWTCTGGANQRWTITPSGTGYAIASEASGLLITAASATSGAKLTQQPAGASTPQIWALTKV